MKDFPEPHLHKDIRSPSRLEEITKLGLASKHQHPALQELVDTACDELGLPIGLVSIVLDGAQYFAVMRGLSGWLEKARGTPIEWSFCANVVAQREPFVVTDATEDPRLQGNPLVSQEGIHAYAGVPLETSKGEIVGSFCVIGNEQRSFTEEDVDLLRRLAADAMRHIEQGRLPEGRGEAKE